ncbi:MAG: alpha/beta fold hydrolase [Acidimicrobiia bacterium]
MTANRTTTFLRHNKIDLALHQLRSGEGRALLVLNGLGESSPLRTPESLASWPGPIYALDITGHGESTVPQGGGYSSEVMMADADVALGHLGAATVYGRGQGAYLALMLAGSRPEEVKGAILDDGPGIAGGGSTPPSGVLLRVDTNAPSPPDPFAMHELALEVRPPDYATSFVRQAVYLNDLDPCIVVCARTQPEWLAAVAGEYGVREEPLEAALARFGAIP